MNLYQFHTEPETLLHHDIAHDKIPKLIWEKYRNNPAELKKREAAIAQDTKSAFYYALRIIEGPFPAGEAAIAQDSFSSYSYAKNVLFSQFPAGEAAIAKDGRYAYNYARYVLRKPFPAGEAAIAKSEYADDYRDFLESIVRESFSGSELSITNIAIKKFNDVIQNPRTRFCHESPEPPSSFYKRGIIGDSVFCTVNQASNFIFSPVKTRIWFGIPKGTRVVPDMRYEHDDEDELEDELPGIKDLVEQHPDITGADVCVTRSVPISWVLSIEQVDSRGAITVWRSD